MKKMFKQLLSVMLIFVSTHSSSAIIQLGSDGATITGINDVVINGVSYNATFSNLWTGVAYDVSFAADATNSLQTLFRIGGELHGTSIDYFHDTNLVGFEDKPDNQISYYTYFATITGDEGSFLRGSSFINYNQSYFILTDEVAERVFTHGEIARINIGVGKNDTWNRTFLDWKVVSVTAPSTILITLLGSFFLIYYRQRKNLQ